MVGFLLWKRILEVDFVIVVLDFMVILILVFFSVGVLFILFLVMVEILFLVWRYLIILFLWDGLIRENNLKKINKKIKNM